VRADWAEAGLPLRDSEILRALIFLERLAANRDNGRRRCRGFLVLLHGFYDRAAAEAEPPSSPLILP
jgi:hypothetical protein